ncbi:MAG: hypothetical protein Q8W46_05720 [Candidatus Palauibacterales bacterium]|jgi:hypothetical protein|nr:hypothetical protein [Candidatus Palauibacterales bacterium]
MQVEIRRISIRSAFKLAMVLYGLIGFLVGFVLAVAASVEVPPGTEPNILTRLGFWSIAVFPVLYGLAGGLTAAVAVALYNAGASLVGGLRLDFPEVEPESDGRVRVAGRAARYLERMLEREKKSRASQPEPAESGAEDRAKEAKP